MPNVQREIVIAAKPEQVWEVIADPHHVTKLYPDSLSVSFEPHSPSPANVPRAILAELI